MGTTVTSIKVDEQTWKLVKIRCIELNIELNEALSMALKLWLKSSKKSKLHNLDNVGGNKQ